MNGMLYHASMTRFGLRKKLKKLLQSVTGEEAEPAPPYSPPPAAARAATPGPSTASEPEPEPPAAPVAEPEPSVAASPPPPPPEPEDPGAGSLWVHLKRVNPDEIESGTIRRIDVFGQRMAVAFVDGKFHVLEGNCPHGPGQLGDGDLEGHVVTCPVHGLQFDVRDGGCVTDPDMVATPVSVKVKGDKVLVMVPA